MLAACLLLVGCDGSDPRLGDEAAGSTWEVIQARILTPNCTNGCHVAGSPFAAQSGLVLTPDVAYGQLVGAVPANAAARADGLLRAGTEGLPSLYMSFLWEKINAPDQEHFYADHPDYGALMPLGAPPLTKGELELVRQWIVAGAPEDGVVADAERLLADTTRYRPPRSFEPLAPPPQGLAFRLGPFDVPPNHEREIFYYEPSARAAPLFVNRVEISMRPGSHHFLLYTLSDNLPDAAQPPPQTYRDLHNLDGTLVAETVVAMPYHVYFAGTQWPRLDYRFPEGVALRLDAGVGLDLNAHYVNRTSTPSQGEVHVNLHTVDEADVTHVARVLWINNQDITLPPGQVTTLTHTRRFNRRTEIFQLFSHAHEHMAEFRVEVVGGARDGEVVYVTYDWEHPPILELDPPLVLEAGQGLRLVATYNNWTDRTLHYGLLSQDEMMMLFGYYY